MKKPTDMLSNRTGIQVSPALAKKMTEGATKGVPEAFEDMESITQMRLEYSSDAEPVGTLARPAGKVKSKAPAILLDLLGERMAFERAGVRLYELLLIKIAAAHVHKGGPTVNEIEHFRDDELRHFGMCVNAIRELGADPTSITPSADISSVASSGVLHVIADPRTTLTQALQGMRIIELADQEAWASLVDLVERLELTRMAEDFQGALFEENLHMRRVRAWIESAIAGQAGIAPTPLGVRRAA